MPAAEEITWGKGEKKNLEHLLTHLHVFSPYRAAHVGVFGLASSSLLSPRRADRGQAASPEISCVLLKPRAASNDSFSPSNDPFQLILHPAEAAFSGFHNHLWRRRREKVFTDGKKKSAFAMGHWDK